MGQMPVPEAHILEDLEENSKRQNEVEEKKNGAVTQIIGVSAQEREKRSSHALRPEEMEEGFSCRNRAIALKGRESGAVCSNKGKKVFFLPK